MSASEQRPQPRPGIMKISRYVGGEGGLPGIDEPIRLASNESALGPSPQAIAAYAAAKDSLHRYADGGAASLRRALGARHGIDPGRIVVGNGSDEIIGLVTKAYAGPGDEVLFSRHGFAMYPIATLTAGATPVMAPETDYRADVDAMLDLVSERTKIVFLANPNNPTGSYLSAAEVARLHAGLPPDVLFVVDAAYAEYVTRNDYTDGLELAQTHDNVAMMRTFSKIYGLAALRVGWCYAAPAVCDVLHRTRGPFNVNAAAQAAALAALDDVGHIDRARAHNDIWLPWFSEQVEQLGLTVLPSIGNFVLVGFPSEDGKNADAAEAHLKADGVIPRPVAGYGLPDFLRITVGLEDEMRAVVASLRTFVGR
ncbi:MAG: histidinol-phosphate transaminase [Rhodospirillaceae bacterium]|nr:histidinol-phosphate transaminase [Rhodospirillaceae bacterium]